MRKKRKNWIPDVFRRPEFKAELESYRERICLLMDSGFTQEVAETRAYIYTYSAWMDKHGYFWMTPERNTEQLTMELNRREVA